MLRTYWGLNGHIRYESDRDIPWSISLVIPPRAEPMSLKEGRKHLRLTEDDPTDEDDLVESWIASSRESAEDFLGRQLILATWDLTLDRFPCGDVIRVPMPPLRDVVSIAYTAEDGTEDTVSLSDVIVDRSGEPGRIVLKANKSWPSDTLQAASGVVIRFKSGYAVPFTVNAEDDTVTARDHPYVDGDRVRLWNSGGSLPDGLSAQTDYFAAQVSGDDLKLSTEVGGDPIDITGSGSGLHFLGLLPQGVRSAMKLTLGSRFEHREDIVVGQSVAELPQPAQSLLWAKRVWYPGP